MQYKNSVQSIFFLVAIFFASFVVVPAQLAKLELAFGNKPAEETSEVKPSAFRERELGWVSGRVITNLESDAADVDAHGVPSVKVILRSTKPEYSSFVREQYTNEIGSYDFPDVGPGDYTVQIDTATLPANYRSEADSPMPVKVRPLDRSYINIGLVPQRVISGVIYIDKDNDGVFKPGKDEVVEGAFVTTGLLFAVSDEKGMFVLKELPAGRVGLLVNWPKGSDSTHVLLDLGSGPVTNRVINIPIQR